MLRYTFFRAPGDEGGAPPPVVRTPDAEPDIEAESVNKGGRVFVPKSRFDEVNQRGHAALATAAQAQAAHAAAVAELANTRARAQLERHLLTSGVSGDDLDEAADELFDRYQRMPGDKPKIADFIESVKTKKWAAPYFAAAKPSPVADPLADAPTKEPAAMRPPSPAPNSAPNAGTRAATPPAVGARWTPDRVRGASQSEIVANLPSILSEMHAAGEIRSPTTGPGAALLARLGIK